MKLILNTLGLRRQAMPPDLLDHPEIARMSRAELDDLPMPRPCAASCVSGR